MELESYCGLELLMWVGVGAKGFRFVLGLIGTPNYDPLHQTMYQKLRNEPYFFLKW